MTLSGFIVNKLAVTAEVFAVAGRHDSSSMTVLGVRLISSHGGF